LVLELRLYEIVGRKSYNRHLSHTGLKVAGKAALVAAGVAFGFHKGLSGGDTPAIPCPASEVPPPEKVPPGEAPPPEKVLREEVLREELNSVAEDVALRDVNAKDKPSLARLSRFESIENRLNRLEEGAGRAPANSATLQDLAEAIAKATESISNDIDRRFEVQRLSIHSLRALIAQTDVLLEQVLRRLEDAAE
jgi:hypothetical protein